MESRTVENVDPESIDSAIQPLIKEFFDSPWTWLPERRQELRKLQDQLGIRFTIDETNHTFLLSAKSETKTIRIGLTTMERIWGYCFGLEKLYDFLRVQGAGVEIDATQFPELLPARAVLTAVYASEKAKAPVQWTSDLASPRSASSDEDVQIANVRFISVASFMMLHEIAHIVLKHPTETYVSQEEMKEQEFEADLWAMNFTMDRLAEHNTSDDHFIARANGIVLGLCILSSVELNCPNSASRDHPSIPERLLRFFDKYIPDTSEARAHLREQPKFFAATILKAFLLNEEIDIDFAKTYADLFDPIIDVRKHFPG